MKKVVCFGEMLLRLGAPRPETLLQSARLDAHFCGAEANVAVSLAHFGHHAAVVTTLPDGVLGHACLGDLRRHGVDVSAILRSTGRMGLYFLTPGAMMRPSKILYDRAGSAFSLADPENYDWPKILEGADWLHVSGITPALGPQAAKALEHAIEAAKAGKVAISFDCNYRPSLWRGREQEAPMVIKNLAHEADLLFAGARDATFLLGTEIEPTSPEKAFETAAKAFFSAAPRLKYLASTDRIVHGADDNDLTGYFASRQSITHSPLFPMRNIIDRIGGGDAFAAGVLHGLCAEYSQEHNINFATTAAAYKHSLPGDFNTASVSDIEQLLSEGGGDVRR